MCKEAFAPPPPPPILSSAPRAPARHSSTTRRARFDSTRRAFQGCGLFVYERSRVRFQEWRQSLCCLARAADRQRPRARAGSAGTTPPRRGWLSRSVRPVGETNCAHGAGRTRGHGARSGRITAARSSRRRARPQPESRFSTRTRGSPHRSLSIHCDQSITGGGSTASKSGASSTRSSCVRALPRGGARDGRPR
jgi:hypothetical protein